jgi:hypothetical protein
MRLKTVDAGQQKIRRRPIVAISILALVQLHADSKLGKRMVRSVKSQNDLLHV